ncbi:MAG TPA: hypothetical protein DDW93_01010 [Firmicutes bacterium]|jgi:spore germination protein GerM|nr:hypothetical protein [Bacillota bacterium]
MRKNTGLFLILLLLVIGICVFLLYMRPGFLRRGAKQPQQPQVPPLSGEERVEKVRLYFPNQEYVQTGREDLPMLKTVDREVKIKDESLIEAILKELRNPPEGKGLTTALYDQLEVLGAWTKERLAYVNFSSENLHGGSLQEMLLVNQIVKTLTALPGIDQVQFLVDGEKRETLMGHLSTDEPLSGDHL